MVSMLHVWLWIKISHMKERERNSTCPNLYYIFINIIGISRDHWHKRRATGGKRKPIRKKRKFELGRPAANTKLGPQRIHTVSFNLIFMINYRSKRISHNN